MVLLIVLIGIVLTLKGHLIQRNAFLQLGNTLSKRDTMLEKQKNQLTLEEESLFIASLSGIRMKIIGVLLIALTASVLILLNLLV
jgi:hypothetical protein